MSEKLVSILFLFYILCVSCVRSDRSKDRRYSRFSDCRPHETDDDSTMVKIFSSDGDMQNLAILPTPNEKNEKGAMGIIGILGGTFDTNGGVYFAGMSALRVGADEVHIYLIDTDCAQSIQWLNPEFIMHYYKAEDANKMLEDMNNTVDILILGSGIQLNYKNVEVVKMVAQGFKNEKKPLIIDLDVYFYTVPFIEILEKYPAPGVILMVNSTEFETIYPLIKSEKAFSDFQVDINYEKFGPNFLVYRKGCNDMLFANDPEHSWSYNTEFSETRRTKGQGNVIAGAAAVYYHWALLPNDYLKGHNGTAMLPSSAVYVAAKLMREINEKSYIGLRNSAITCTMVQRITDVLYSRDPYKEEQIPENEIWERDCSY